MDEWNMSALEEVEQSGRVEEEEEPRRSLAAVSRDGRPSSARLLERWRSRIPSECETEMFWGGTTSVRREKAWWRWWKGKVVRLRVLAFSSCFSPGEPSP